MSDLLTAVAARMEDPAPGDGCEVAAAVAREVYELADLLGQLFEVVRRQDEMIGFLLDMSR